MFDFLNQCVDFSFAGIDLIFRDDGMLVLQEANGSNAASTGGLSDGLTRRARHMADTAIGRRGIQPGSAILLPYANSTGLRPEFHARQELLAEMLSERGLEGVRPVAAGVAVASHETPVVVGPMNAFLPHLTVGEGQLAYDGKPVAFATNPNILPALQRAIGKAEAYFDTNLFHEGSRGVRVALDKTLQQRLAEGTSFTALDCEECSSWDAACDTIERWLDADRVPVAKIARGSQGVGVEFFPDRNRGAIRRRISAMRDSALQAYGPRADDTALPVSLFEFAPSTRYRLGDGGHLWDIRVEAHITPGRTTLIPTSMRLCPAPFNGAFARESVLSNLSGRNFGMRFVRLPFAAHASGGCTELEWAGVDEVRFTAAMSAVAAWCDRVGQFSP